LFISGQIEALIVLNNVSYVPKPYHTFLLMIFFTALNIVVHTFGKRILPKLQTSSMVCHILFFFIIVTVLLVMSKKASSIFVWTNFQNNGGWNNDGISFCIGLLLPAFSISGADGCVHMAEEVRHANRNIPKAFIWTLIINGTMAFVMVVVCVYCITDLHAVLNSRTGYPIIEIFYQATGSVAGATVLDVMMILIMIPCSFCLGAASSRLAWSFSRENGFPGSKFMRQVGLVLEIIPTVLIASDLKVNPRFKAPLNAIYVSVTFATLLSCIVLGSEVALDAVVSLCTIAAFASYILPIASFTWYKLTHKDVEYGPWRMGRWGIFVNIFAICWCGFFVIILPFPTTIPVTAANMNWSGPIFLAVTLVLTADWFLRAHRQYHGPVIEIEGFSTGDEDQAAGTVTTVHSKVG